MKEKARKTCPIRVPIESIKEADATDTPSLTALIWWQKASQTLETTTTMIPFGTATLTTVAAVEAPAMTID
jgi:hypothetical protein